MRRVGPALAPAGPAQGSWRGPGTDWAAPPAYADQPPMGATGGCAPAPVEGFPPEFRPGAPPADADQPQAWEDCQGPSAHAYCAAAGAEVGC
eukprot:12171136-Alexandrium_andersonii.AAC.1